MSFVSNLDDEVTRLTDLLIPYLCERTGFSGAQIQTVLDAQNAFWSSQPSVIAQMVIVEMSDDEDTFNVG